MVPRLAKGSEQVKGKGLAQELAILMVQEISLARV
jgi:hypothetical protein